MPPCGHVRHHSLCVDAWVQAGCGQHFVMAGGHRRVIPTDIVRNRTLCPPAPQSFCRRRHQRCCVLCYDAADDAAPNADDDDDDVWTLPPKVPLCYAKANLQWKIKKNCGNCIKFNNSLLNLKSIGFGFECDIFIFLWHSFCMYFMYFLLH